MAISKVQVSHVIQKFSGCLGKIGMLFEISRMFNCFVDDIGRSGSGFLTSNLIAIYGRWPKCFILTIQHVLLCFLSTVEVSNASYFTENAEYNCVL